MGCLFGTERSEVRILSPRPLLLRKWTTRQSGLRVCDVVVDVIINIVVSVGAS